MSRETEKILKQLTRYMAEHQDDLGDAVSEEDLAQQFMTEYNASLRPKNVLDLPRTADDYLELAENVTTKKKKLEYLSKALELEPDNLDVFRMIAELNAKKPEELLAALSSLLEKGNSLMEQGGSRSKAKSARSNPSDRALSTTPLSSARRKVRPTTSSSAKTTRSSPTCPP